MDNNDFIHLVEIGISRLLFRMLNFAGLLWLTFVLMIFHHFYILKASAKNSTTQTEYDVLFLIFLSYLIQASISPDHLVLTVYGMMSAGAILGRYMNHINGEVRTINANKINKWLKKIIFGRIAIPANTCNSINIQNFPKIIFMMIALIRL
jgi:hypothetical protein